MRKKTTLTRVFMALILTLTMMVSSTTVFAAEATTENGDQHVITTDNETASAVETRASSQIRTFKFNASTGLRNKPATTTFLNSTISVSITDNYNPDNIYLVTVVTPNNETNKFVWKGDGKYFKLGKFFLEGQYNVSCSLFDGVSKNQTVTLRVKFSNEL